MNLTQLLIKLGGQVSASAREALHRLPVEERSAPTRHDGADVIFRIDDEVEPIIDAFLESHAETLGGVVLIAEGMGVDGKQVYPAGSKENDAALRFLVDPIDGTRGLMFDKRSAFFLAGIADNRPGDLRLSDIHTAVMVEIPTTRAFLQDELWAIRGQGAQAQTRNLVDHSVSPRVLQPSRAKELRGGFGQISRFFHPGKEVLAELEEELMLRLYPEVGDEAILTFEDQYASSGGQLYELLTGKDRWIADLRDGLFRRFRRAGQRIGHVCHPYDLSAHLIGQEAGIELTDRHGEPLDGPFDTLSPMDWIGYANRAIRDEIEPALQELIDQFDIR